MAQHDMNIANDTGSAVRADLNNALAALVSQNSGATEPATTFAYQMWADTTTGLLKIRNAANSAWITVGSLADANLGLLPLSGAQMTGLFRNRVVASIASAATLDLTTADANMITTITGTTTVTAVTMPAGVKVDAIAGGAFTLTNGANLVVAGGANYTCTAGDRLTFMSFDGTKVYVWIEKADGAAVVGTGTVLASGETSGDGGSGSGSNVSMAQLTGIDLSAASGKVLLVYGRTAIEEASNTANTAILRLRIWEATAGWTTIGTARIEQYLTAGSGNAIREISRTARYVIPSAYAKTGVTLELQGGIDTGTFYYGDQPSYTNFDGEGAGYALGYIVFG